MADLSQVVVSGPLERFAAGFAVELSRQGFKPTPVRQQLELVSDLSGWLAAERVALSGLSLEVAERFCAARRAAGCTSRGPPPLPWSQVVVVVVVVVVVAVRNRRLCTVFSRASAHACVRARPSGSPAAWSASYSTGERIPSVECSRVGL